MDLDEIKQLWNQHNQELESSLRLNALLLQQWNLRKADTTLKRLARGITLDLVMNIIGVALIGWFIGGHASEPRFLIPAILLDVYAIALVAAEASQLARLHSLDYDEPVVAIQHRLEALKLYRIRTTLWTLLFGPLMWVPLLIVAARGVFGADVYAAGPLFLAANVLFGLAVIPIAVFIARRFGSRLERWKPMRVLADEIAGRSLIAALDDLAAVRRFAEEG